MKNNKRKRNQTDLPYQNKAYDKKTKYNREKRNRMPSILINRTPTFMPDVFVTKQKLSVTSTLTSTSGAIAQAQILGNSMFDPQGAGGSQQPSGFDQLALLYKDFVVTGSRCKVQVCPRGVVGTDVVLCPVANTQAVFTTTDQAAEQPRSKRAYGFLYDKLILDQYVATSSMFGAPTEKVIADEDYAGSGTADAPTTFSWLVSYQPSDKNTTSTIDLIVEITYYVRWYNRILRFDV